MQVYFFWNHGYLLSKLISNWRCAPRSPLFRSTAFRSWFWFFIIGSTALWRGTLRNAVLRVQGKPCAQPERPACRPPPPCARGVPRACRARAAARDGLCRGSACNVRLSLVWIWVNLSGARPCAAALPRRAPVLAAHSMLAAHFVLAAHSVLAAMCRELYHAPVQRRATACVAPSPRGCGLWLQCA